MLLATPWFPNLNIVGPGSLGPLAIVLCYAAIAWKSQLRILMYAAPVLFAGGALYISDASPLFTRRFPDADDYVGFYILNVAAACFGLELVRRGSLAALICGGMAFSLLGLMIADELVTGAFHELFRATRVRAPVPPGLVATVIWLPTSALIVLGASRYGRDRRVKLGLCEHCGYDLRASADRCPECGTPMTGKRDA